jgi:hypothetical protein
MTATMACAAWGTAPAHAAISITETDADSLRYATAPGWEIMGNAKLTVPASIDPDSQGWLRLTENQLALGGTAVYDTVFSSTEGLEIIFDYAMYGGTGADGMSFYLIHDRHPTCSARALEYVEACLERAHERL